MRAYRDKEKAYWCETCEDVVEVEQVEVIECDGCDIEIDGSSYHSPDGLGASTLWACEDNDHSVNGNPQEEPSKQEIWICGECSHKYPNKEDAGACCDDE